MFPKVLHVEQYHTLAARTDDGVIAVAKCYSTVIPRWSSHQVAAELARRWNAHDALVEACEYALLISRHSLEDTTPISAALAAAMGGD